MKNDSLDIGRVLLGVVAAKFGPGAIGRIGTIAIAGMVLTTLMAALFAFVNIYLAGGAVLLTVVQGLYAMHCSFRYAEKHPVLAAMDGAQISRMIQNRGSMRPLDGLPPPPTEAEILADNPLIELKAEETK